MKTQNILLLLLIVLLTGCFSEKHLEFMNVPMNGNIDKYARELISLGFTVSTQTKEDQIVLNGEYLEKNSEIYLYGTSKSKTIYKVTVNLPGEVRDSLETSFIKTQKLYTSKYGNGRSKYRQFKNASRFMFNESKRVWHVSIGDNTRYTTDAGIITVEVREGYISITYLDKLNNEIGKRELQEVNLIQN